MVKLKMNWILRIVYQIVRLLLELTVRGGLMLLGCGVRLLFWSVRTYGWGRVGGFLVALFASLWINLQLDWLSGSAAMLFSTILGTFILWGLVAGLFTWGSRQWQTWMNGSARLPASPNGGYAFPISAPQTFMQSLPGQFREAPAPAASPGFSGVPLSPAPARVESPLPAATALTEAGSLLQEILQLPFMQNAWQRVHARGGGPGSDEVTVEAFSLDAERQLLRIIHEIRTGAYAPRLPRRVEMLKRSGGMRRLAVLCVRDRVVQQALYLILAPRWDKKFAACSYAYRPGRSALQAVNAVEKALLQGRVWVVDADIKSFFDTVPHPQLYTLLDEWLPDASIRGLMQQSISAVSASPGLGLAQGAPLSPLLANLYLHRFDTALLQAGQSLVRYADDFIILCATGQQAEEAMRMATRLLEALNLSLNLQKTRILHRDEGFTFLGYHFTRDGKRPSEEALQSLQTRLAAATGETKRRQVLAGWQGYFRGADVSAITQAAPASGIPPAEESAWLDPWWPEAGNGEAGSGNGHGGSSPLNLYREWFVARADVYARYWQNETRNGYLPVRSPLPDEELNAHLQGQVILGGYFLKPEDSTTPLLVLDIDGPEIGAAGQQKALPVARQIFSALAQEGIVPLWLDSGGKGYHIWLCFRQPVSARVFRQRLMAWLERFRPYPEGVVVEIFPKQDSISAGGLGSLIRLPLGKHPETGRWNALLTGEGQPVADSVKWLQSASKIDPEAFLRAMGVQDLSQPELKIPEPPEKIASMVQGCELLRALVSRAAQKQHLRHTERLSLLYTLGACGEIGRNYLHQVIALCSNYDPRVTERWVQRLEEGHKPIRCATLKEWLKDYLPDVKCPCPSGKGNSTPFQFLDLARKDPEELPEPQPETPGPVKGWEEVARDIFGDETIP